MMVPQHRRMEFDLVSVTPDTYELTMWNSTEDYTQRVTGKQALREAIMASMDRVIESME